VLFGRPGTGKTTFAKGIASRLGWPFVEIEPPRLGAQGPDRKARPAICRRYVEEIIDEDVAALVDATELLTRPTSSSPPARRPSTPSSASTSSGFPGGAIAGRHRADAAALARTSSRSSNRAGAGSPATDYHARSMPPCLGSWTSRPQLDQRAGMRSTGAGR
jgi:hypothetical protein